MGTVLSWTVPLALVAVAARVVPLLHPLDDGWQYLLVLIAGVVQAQLLRPHVRSSFWWAAVTALGTAAAVLVYTLVFAGPAQLWRSAPPVMADGLSALADLLLVAVPQWLWLRRRVARARWWLVACGMPAAIIGLLGALGQLATGGETAPVDESVLAVVLSAGFAALLLAIPQASAMIRLLRRPFT